VWLGNLGWLLRSDDKLIPTDLDLDRDTRLSPSPIPAEEIGLHLDALFTTHEHGNHFSGPTTRILVDSSSCQFIVPANCVARAHEFGIPDNRLTVAIPDHQPQG